MTKKLTPAQQQYMDLKQEHKDALLFFRLGDFYELFYEDAKIAHRELGITLTARHKNSPHPIPMAGVPYHSAEKYLKKLVQAGYKVAIAEQVGTVVPGKVVERKVVRVVTPGTEIYDEIDFSYIAALYYSGGEKRNYHLAWGDISLGNFFTQSFDTLEDLLKQVLFIQPQEIVVDIDFAERESLEQYIHQVLSLVLSFDDVPHDTLHYLQNLTGTSSLEGYGKALQEGREKALALLFSYTEKMQKQGMCTIHRISYVNPKKYIHFDETTMRNLEVFLSRAESTVKHSLYGVINTCKTAMGSRLLQDRLAHPLRDEVVLSNRLASIEYFVEQKEERNSLRTLLHGMIDLPRLMSRVLYRTAQATKVQQLMLSIKNLLHSDDAALLKHALLQEGLDNDDLLVIEDELDHLLTLLQQEHIQDDMGYICDGYDEEVDRYRQIAYHSDDLLLAYQQEIMQYISGVKVKVKYVKNQGYCLEVTPKDIARFESYSKEGDEKFGFIRRQTLKTGQRYTTDYLSTLETKILDAKMLLKKREMELLVAAIDRLRARFSSFFSFFEVLGKIDLATSFADFAEQKGWTKPLLGKDFDIQIKQGRHPVVEAFLEKTQQFIPNDCLLNKEQFFHLITGPNMGGKSTFLRQNALIVLLAHAGLYVPASYAKISIVDGIFARIGSGDALAKNQSTFMTEMLEVANILHNASDKSFIILDELGRGTSTYDGLAIAKAISVFMCQELKAKVLFATHYHELTELSQQLKGYANFSVSVYETDNEVVFLKKVVKGKASKSYGIDVAKLAGIPAGILQKAQVYLEELEKNHTKKRASPLQQGFDFGTINDEYKQKYEFIKQELETITLDEITPIEALVFLQKLKKQIKYTKMLN